MEQTSRTQVDPNPHRARPRGPGGVTRDDDLRTRGRAGNPGNSRTSGTICVRSRAAAPHTPRSNGIVRHPASPGTARSSTVPAHHPVEPGPVEVVERMVKLADHRRHDRIRSVSPAIIPAHVSYSLCLLSAFIVRPLAAAKRISSPDRSRRRRSDPHRVPASSRQRPSWRLDARRQPTAMVAAGLVARDQGRHEPVGETAFGLLIGAGHGEDHLAAGQRIALAGVVPARRRAPPDARRIGVGADCDWPPGRTCR